MRWPFVRGDVGVGRAAGRVTGMEAGRGAGSVARGSRCVGQYSERQSVVGDARALPIEERKLRSVRTVTEARIVREGKCAKFVVEER